jgi:hypothetical protein
LFPWQVYGEYSRRASRIALRAGHVQENYLAWLHHTLLALRTTYPMAGNQKLEHDMIETVTPRMICTSVVGNTANLAIENDHARKLVGASLHLEGAPRQANVGCHRI